MANEKLSTYQAMRDFSATPEPSGETPIAPSDRLRFIIQKHAATRLHYDFRLEWEGVMLSWAVTKGPSLDPEDKRLAVETEPHPMDYGDFEGTIPKGQYGGGTVLLWDRGYWEPAGEYTFEAGLKKGHLRFRVDGERLQGEWHLIRLKGDRGKPSKRTNWLLFKSNDAHARPGDADRLLVENTTSIASGRSMEEIAAGVGRPPEPFITAPARKPSAKAVWRSNRAEEAQDPSPAPPPAEKKPSKRAAPKKGKMPDFVEPQLAKLVDHPPQTGGWAHEIKFDGYRMQLRVEGGKATLRTRKGLDWTAKFKEIAADAADWHDCMVDGEAVALDDKGMPSFPGLQDALSTGKTAGLVFYAFDMLFQQGLDVRELPLSERKQRLAEMMGELEGPEGRLRYVDHFETAGTAVLESACRMDLEGIISKRVEAPYRSGRGEAWVKSKCRGGQEVVIGGWTGEGDRFRSLIAGVWRGGEFVYVGRIGTGYTRASGEALRQKLLPLETRKSPFAGKKPPIRGVELHWVKPELVAEIEFAGWTGDGNIRQASFKGLREDKPAEEVVLEGEAAIAESVAPGAAEHAVEEAEEAAAAPVARAKGKTKAKAASAVAPSPAPAARGKPSTSEVVRKVTISSAAKVLWPGTEATPAFTKHDLALYLDAVGERMIPHFAGRPVSVVRTPEGIEGERFFQRHAMPGQSALVSLMNFGERKPYIAADTIEALIALGQIGATEMHPWNNQPGQSEIPGRFVFDLDPAPDVPFEEVIQAARDVRDWVTELGLVAFCKTTGGKGLHVVTLLAREKSPPDWATAKAFAKAVCQTLVNERPDKYVLNMSKSVRGGRIFLDYLRNDRMATAVGPYSPRARPGAPVSMPVRWSQVKKGLDPMAFTIASVPALLKKPDPWADYDEGARPFSDALRRLGAGARAA